MKTRIVLILLSIFFCVLNVAQGQDSLYLTVEKLFALAESNSGQLKLDAIRIQDAEAGIVNAFQDGLAYGMSQITSVSCDEARDQILIHFLSKTMS